MIAKKILLALVGLGTGVALFWFSTKSVNLEEVKRILLLSNWRWVAVGVLLFGVDFLLRAARWDLIVSADGHVRYLWLLRGLVVGYTVNVLLPARLGELFRAEYTARITKLNRSRILGSIFVERLVDLAVALLLFIGGISTVRVADVSVERVIIATVVASGAGATFACLFLSSSVRHGLRVFMNYLLSKVLNRRLAGQILTAMSDFSQTVRIIQSRRMLGVLGFTFLVWLFEAGSMWSVCKAVGLNLSSLELITLLGGASLSTLFPTAPGFVGSYQFAFVVILGLFEVRPPLAIGAASGIQIYLMGIYAIVGLTVWWIGSLQRSSTKQMTTKASLFNNR